jgi:hypothetical protein
VLKKSNVNYLKTQGQEYMSDIVFFCEKSDIVFDCIKRGCVVWFQLKHLKASTTAYVTILKNYRLNSGGYLDISKMDNLK